MFLTKSKSKTEVYVLLPDKPTKFMISATENKDRMKMERKCVRKSSGKDVARENELKREMDHENNNSILSKEFSDMLWIKPTEKDNTALEKRGIIDLMNMGKKYENFKGTRFQDEKPDFAYNRDCSDQSLTSSDDICESPTRLSPKERKSVRFEDELFDSTSSFDDSVLTETRKQTEIESPRCDERSIKNMSGQRTSKSDLYSKQFGEKLGRQGLLTRALWQNPFNIKQEGRGTVENKFFCHQCEKTFKYQSNLRSHIKTIHSADLFRSGSQTSLRSIDDLFMCDECSLVFKYSVNLRAHRASHQRNKLNATI